ncbi:type II toxin-antitoxin system RelE/ParE family toxin [Methylomonas sp. UP202]|uniref:Addiction module protein n=1 Tax=Methylomonas koyamae TaxID=702114 RepID=A0A177P6L4_9GAMM|nr:MULTISPECIES: type II toxin-antitoxin system RelE/ParE family toxin [Methylomonas]OAI25069.1 addiction module protein [Methylomonas koyamae]WGS85006.1 type II toxin-antitoxin system RelE/ParE family toxin [Methylomonas sp. UP202]
MYRIEDYRTADGRLPLKEWLSTLADRQAKARVLTRLQRMATGNLGDCKPVQDGVWELRIDYGPGYRVYYGQAGDKLLLLLIGGDKRKQQADIAKAVDYWHDWKRRTRYE